MARLLRTQPPQSRIEPPQVVNPAFVAAPVQVNFATGLLTSQRRAQQRRSSGFVQSPASGPTLSPVGSSADVADNFTRADSGSLGTGWNSFWPNGIGITSNKAVASSGTGGANRTDVVDWTDVEVQLTLGTRSVSTDTSVLARVQTPNASGASAATPVGGGYRLRISGTSLNLEVANAAGTFGTVLGSASLGSNLVSGDAILLRCIGRTIEGWYKRAGGQWIKQFSVSNSAWSIGTVGFAFSGAALNPEALAFQAGRVLTTVDASLALRSPFLGVRPPAAFAGASPVQTTVSVNAASGLLTNQRRAQQRRTRAYVAPTPVVGPPVIAGFIASPPEITFVRTRPRGRIAGVAPPVAVQPAVTFEAASTPRVQTRPRPTRKRLAPPTVVRTPAVEQVEQTITVHVVRTRPRPRVAHVEGPVVVAPPSVFSGPEVSITRTRPRRTDWLLPPVLPVGAAPFVPPPLSINCLQPDRLARRHRRQLPASNLGAPVVAAGFVAPPLSVNCLQPDRLARRHRRKTPDTTLSPPTVLAVFAGPVARRLVRTRPRPRTAYITPPAYLAVGVAPPLNVNCLPPDRLARRHRRKPPDTTLGQPTVLAVFAGPAVHAIVIRPRPTRARLFAPATLEPAAVALNERDIRSALTRIRSPRVRSLLFAPAVVTTEQFVAPPIDVLLVTRDTRISMRRRLPLQGWDGDSAAGPSAPGRYPNTILAAGPLSYWRLGEASGAATAVDQIGGNNGTYGGTVTLGQPGLVTGDPETAAAFGSGNGTVSVPTPLLAGQSVWTFECLFRGPNNGVSQRVLYEESGTNDLVQIRTGTGSLAMTYRDDAGVSNSISLQGTSGRLDDGAVHHILITRNGTAIQAVIDGTRVANNTIGGGAQTETITALIGRTASGPNGSMQEVAIYHRQLSAGEALQHYLAAVAGAPGQVVYLRRNLGPKPPLIVAGAPLSLETLVVKTSAITRRNTETRRRAHWLLAGPTVLAQPPPVGYAVAVTLVHTRPRFSLQGWNGEPSYGESVLSAAVLADLPSLYWLLNEAVPGTGSAADASGNGRNGTYVASPQSVPPLLAGDRDRAVKFDGATQWITSTYNPYVIGTRLTLECWLLRNSQATTDAFLGSSNGTNPVILRFNAAADTISVWSDGASTPQTWSGFGPTVGRRLYVAFTWDGATKTGELFINGVSQGSKVFATDFNATPGTFKVAGRGGAGTDAFDGTIEKVAVHGAILPSATIAARFQQGTATAGPGQPGGYQRFIGPRLPLVLGSPPQTIAVVSGAVRPSRLHASRKTIYALPRPTVTPSVEEQEDRVRVSLARTRPRPTTHDIASPSTLRVFFGPTIATVRTRPRPTVRRLVPPVVVRIPSVERREQTIAISAVRIRPRHTASTLFPPTVVTYPPAKLGTVAVTLVRTRPRPTRAALTPPRALQVFLGAKVTLTRTRPRPRTAYVTPPAYLAVVQTFAGPPVTLAHTRPRRTAARLAPPTVVRVAAVEQTVRVLLAHTRPRPTSKRLGGPTALSTFVGPTVHLVSIRPRRTVTRLSPPTVVVVQQVESTIRVSLTDSRRPKPQLPALGGGLIRSAPAQNVQTVRVALVATRPRPTTKKLLGQPVVRPLAVADTIRVALVRIRPRLTRFEVIPPATLEPESVALAEREERIKLVTTRPRPTTHRLAPPTVVRVPAVEQVEQTIRVALTRTRPRPTTKLVRPPAALQTFGAAKVALTRIRPRPTERRLLPPTVVRVPSVEQQEATIRTILVRVRPRPTLRKLAPPTVLQVFTGPEITLARIRPRPTEAFLNPPTVVRVPSVEQAEDTIRVSLSRIRPRETVSALRPPTVIRVPAVEQQEQTIRLTLVRARPRPTTKRLSAPAVVIPPPSQRAQTIRVSLAGRTRVEMPRRAPASRLRPPTVIISNPPVVTRITVAEVAVRTRREIPRHTVEHFLRAPTAVVPLPTLRAQTVQVNVVRVRPRPRTAYVTPPTILDQRIYAAAEAPTVRIRPRKTTSFLSEPTVLRVFAARRPALVRTRPRHTISALRPPVVLQEFFGPRETEIAVRTVTEQRRHAPHSHLRAPVVTAPAVTVIRVALARTRPRPTTRRLAPPAVVRPFAVLPISVTAAPSRRPATKSTLAAPTVVVHFAAAAPQTAFAPSRRPAVHSRLARPTVVAPPRAPVAITLNVTLAAVRTRQRFRIGRAFLPPVLPPPGLPKIPKVTGYAISAGQADGDSHLGADSDGAAVTGAASEGRVMPVANSDGTAVPGTATTEGRE